jgi:hypothetical protein
VGEVFNRCYLGLFFLRLVSYRTDKGFFAVLSVRPAGANCVSPFCTGIFTIGFKSPAKKGNSLNITEALSALNEGKREGVRRG